MIIHQADNVTGIASIHTHTHTQCFNLYEGQFNNSITITPVTFFDPGISRLGIYPTDIPAFVQNDIYTRLLNAALL